MCPDVFIKRTASRIGRIAPDVILPQQFRVVRLQEARFILHVRREHCRVKRASGKLPVHDKFLQRCLSVPAEARHHTVEVFCRKAVGIEMHEAPGRTGTNECPCRQIRRVIHIDISETVGRFRSLEHGRQNILGPGQGNLGVFYRNTGFFQCRLQPQRVEQILILRAVEGVDREPPFPDPQFADDGLFTLHRRVPGQDGHSRRIQVVHRGLVGAFGDENHRGLSPLDALVSKHDAFFVDAVNQRKVPVAGQHKAQVTQHPRADGVHGGAGHGIERHQVYRPEDAQTGPGGNRDRVFDGVQIIDADEHADDGHRGADHRHGQVPLKRLRVSDPVDEQAADDTDRHEHRAQSARSRRLEHQGKDHGKKDQCRENQTQNWAHRHASVQIGESDYNTRSRRNQHHPPAPKAFVSVAVQPLNRERKSMVSCFLGFPKISSGLPCSQITPPFI